MDNQGKLYTIGEVAKMTNLSKKMLMYYEEKGLVVPEMRNEKNNYRYYSEKQLEELLMIKMLRRVGLSIDNLSNIMNIRNISSLQSELEVKIKEQKECLIKDVEKLSAYYDIYKQMLDTRRDIPEAAVVVEEADKMPLDNGLAVQFQQTDPQTVLSISFNGRFNSRVIFMEKYAEINSKLEEYDLTAAGNLMVLFYDNYNASFSWDEGEVELCIPIKEKDSGCPFIRQMPGLLSIVSDLKGSYEGFEGLYDNMETWAKKHNLALSGSSIEEYIIDPTKTSNPGQYYSKVYLPLQWYSIK